MNDKKHIRIVQNGPIIVKGGVPLISEEIVADNDGVSVEWNKTNEFPVKESFSLCRCGQSKSKPYCDGSHADCGFHSNDGENGQYLDRAKEIKGKKYTLLDDESLCASARFCDRAGSAWALVEKDDAESDDILYDEVCKCSSGRLCLKDNKTKEIVEADLPKEISVTEDPPADVSGPYWVKGGIEVELPNGKKLEARNRVTLCRCGKSKNMPFCDTSHRSSNFKA